MGFWDAVVLIVLITSIAGVRGARYRSGLLDSRQRDSLPPVNTGRIESQLADLSRRIAVLERIATENRSQRDIAAEIEALRDPRPSPFRSD